MPRYVSQAINLLKNAGFSAYAVGGCVRDTFLKKTPYDWDITTSARPDEMKTVFKDFKYFDAGIKHGTLSVVTDGHILEITTMRVDGGYSDGRHPDSVSFTADIETDLSRRDFTVNAMAYSPYDGFADPFGGREDLKNRIIRCVGEPDRRFNEDALRIIRGLRFASVLGFEIEKNTAESIIKNRALLGGIAKERIRVELLKLLCGKDVRRILMDFAPVFFEIIPELEPMYKFPQNTPYHIYDVWEHTAAAVEAVECDPIFRMTMLLHDLGKPEKLTVDPDGTAHFKKHQEVSYQKSLIILNRLRFSRLEQEEISALIRYHDLRPKGDKTEIKLIASEITPQLFKRLFPIFRADAMAQNPVNLPQKLKELDKSEKELDNAVQNGECMSIGELLINGDNLKNIGFCGKEIGEMLSLLLKKVIVGEVENKKDKLLEVSKALYFNK
ncbi:MAG: CCA tRNA nucleotidyltransferase [Acutalibacteraceae bacterium]